MAQDWQMPRAGKTCFACTRAFDAGEAFEACLYETPEGYERRDYCTACEPPAEPVPLARWKTRRPVPEAKKVQPFDRAAIYEFFRRLEDRPEPETAQFRFVLALLLWRKKVLKFHRELREPDGECWEFIAPASGEIHRVARPELDEDELESLSAQLETLLAGAPVESEDMVSAQDAADAQ